MGFSVVADNASTVNAQHNVPFFNRRVVDQLVVATLQKGRIYGEHRKHTARPKRTGKGDAELLGDAHVVIPAGVLKPSAEILQPGAVLHCRRDGADAGILLRQPDQLLAKHRRKALSRRAQRLAGFNIKARDAVISARVLLCKGIALALLGLHMNDARAIIYFRFRQNITEIFQVMAIHRAKIGKPKLLKKGARINYLL
ncbi:hypothetical protein DSECCO2_524340 [anaerobic digester metagenome]